MYSTSIWFAVVVSKDERGAGLLHDGVTVAQHIAVRHMNGFCLSLVSGHLHAIMLAEDALPVCT